MKKFELRKGYVEVRSKDLKNVSDFPIFDQSVIVTQLIKSFDSLEDAKKALSKKESDIYKFQSHGLYHCGITQFFIEENEYDEDGEWVSGGDVWGWTPLNFS